MIIESDFSAPIWLRNPHAQTIWASRLRRSPPLRLRAERLELPDADFVDLAWCDAGQGPLIVVFHGLEGGVASPYAVGIMAAARSNGWAALTMHFRGCSGVANRLPRGYHSGDTGDIRFLLNTMRARYPQRPLAAVGYSLGGNALLKYLAEEGSDAPLRAACAVSVPFDLAVAAQRLDTGASRFYQWLLVRAMKRRVYAKLKAMDSPIPVATIMRHRNFRSFDDAVTAPLHGFRDVDHYYAESSCGQYLRDIVVPTLIVQARDDPFLYPKAIPGPDALSAAVRLELSQTGGHVGFVYGSPWRPRYWLEERIPAFFSEHVAMQSTP